MNKSLLIVLHGQILDGKITDIGDDPCFDDLPSWGICRPPTRRSVKQGDTLIFIAKVENNYILKGWFNVGDKIDYPTALELFPERQNVIISTTPATHAVRWRYKKLQKKYAAIHGTTTPDFLIQLASIESIFYQRQTDVHEIDNWKCRRIFHFNTKQSENCINTNKCLKSNISLSENGFRNYVVADKDKWEDLDYLQITWEEIVQATNLPKQIRTPKNQHNVLRFDDYKESFLNL